MPPLDRDIEDTREPEYYEYPEEEDDGDYAYDTWNEDTRWEEE